MSGLEQEMRRDRDEHDRATRRIVEALSGRAWILGMVIGVNAWLRDLGRDGR